MWKCEKCGEVNEGEFCGSCGNKKPAEQQNNQQYNQQNSQWEKREPEVGNNYDNASASAWTTLPEKTKKKKNGVAIIFAVIAVIAIIISAVLLVTLKNEKDKNDGGNSTENKQTEVADVEADGNSAEGEEETEEASGTEDETELEKYMRENRESFERQEKAQSDSNMTMKIYAEGDSMVYEISVNNILKAEVSDEMIEGMEEEIYAQKENLKTAMKLIRIGVPSLESIIYRYCDKNGELIHEIEFDDESLEMVETPVAPEKPAEPETKTDTPRTSEKTELEEWVEANSADIEVEVATYETQGITLEIVAEGNSLVYECTMPVSADFVTDEVVDGMANAMDAQKDTMKTALKMIQTEVPSTESIIYRYYDEDGKLIYESEIK